MSAARLFDAGAVVLGYVGSVASWRRPAAAYANDGRLRPTLVIQMASATDEGAHTPAESVTVSGRDALLALREAIDQALAEPSE